jgi:hypothetical protein
MEAALVVLGAKVFEQPRGGKLPEWRSPLWI